MKVLEKLTLKAKSSPLSLDEVGEAVGMLVDEQIAASTKAEFLKALGARGETIDEIAFFAREMRKLSVRPPFPAELLQHEILDVVGTGGDHLSTFNISTCSTLVASAAGVYVAKHGNRASTSPVGSADVMDALHLPFNLPPDEAIEMLLKQRFCYFFAPNYHPAFKHIIPARRLCAQQGLSTVFNLLGPLLNPGNPTAMLVGVPRPELCEQLARVLQALGIRRGMVVSGSVPDGENPARYLDEISPLGPTTVAEFYQPHGLNISILDPSNFPIQKAALADLRGGDAQVNARIIHDVLGGRERGPKRDAVLINSAGALFVAGRAGSLAEGWELAAEIIDNGQAYRKLQELAAAR